jgi:hypothetical protein
MTLPPAHEVTQLLKAWTAGDEQALDKLTPDHTLETSGLVNEVYLRLVDCGQVRWRDRADFFLPCRRN